MQRPAIRYLVYGQACFLVLLLTSIALRPEGLEVNDGLSYFGVHWPTILTYGLGLMLLSYFLLKAAAVIESSSPAGRGLRLVLRAIAILLPGVILTPYSLGPLWYAAHVAVSSTIFVLELGLAIWLTATAHRNWPNRLLICLQVACGLVALFSLPDLLPFELLGQVLFQATFMVLLLRFVAAL